MENGTAGVRRSILRAEVLWMRDHWQGLRLIPECWLFSRSLLTVIAWFSSYFAGNEIYEQYLTRGYFLSPKWLIDIWCRWDSKWYLSIVQYGYQAPENLSAQYSNLAFFPLYPTLIKLLTFWLPARFQTESVYLLTGLIVSNICFLLAMAGIYYLATKLFDEQSATRTILLYFSLPAGFFFSVFYTESLFLFLIVFAFIYAEREKWLAAGILAALAALTRPHGILLLIPLAWIYLSQRKWNLRRIRGDVLFFGLAPLAIVLYFLHLSQLTGDFFAFFQAQGSWGRSLGTSFWQDYFEPLFNRFNRVATLDTMLIAGSLILSVWILIKVPQKAYGTYALISVVILILTGNLFSMTRYTAVIFPLYLFIGNRIPNQKIFTAVCCGLIVIQALLFSGWINYYWIA